MCGLIIETISEVPHKWALAAKHPLQEELGFGHDEQLMRRQAGRGASAFVHSSMEKNLLLLLLLQPTDRLTGKRIFCLFVCVSLVTTVESGVDGT